jgi:ADP-heptose:LPS heptosyltransferase
MRSLESLRDSLHQTLKRAQRRALLADYEDLRLRGHWLEPDGDAPFDVRTFDVVPDPESLRTVLVFKPDELGDAVYALPALAELRRHLPNAKLLLVCRPLTAPLYERAGVVDEIVDYEPPGNRLQRRFGARTLAKRFDGVDLSVYLRTYPAGFHEFLRIPARARLHPLDPRLRSSSVLRAPVSLWGDRRRHQAIQMLEIVSLLTGRQYDFSDVRFPEFRWSEEDADGMRRLVDGGGPFVVLHPFAKDETRRYPEDYWPALLDRLEQDVSVTWVVVGGPEDGAFPARPNLVQAQGQLSIGQTGYLLSRAAGFVGNLSGPAHWAAAQGVPTVTLMSGHSLPNEWAPLGTSLVLRGDVPCAPCHRKTCPVYGLACLTSLTPERVAPEIGAFLRRHI